MGFDVVILASDVVAEVVVERRLEVHAVVRMGLDVVILASDVVAEVVVQRRLMVHAVVRMALDVLADPSLVVLTCHRTSSFIDLTNPDHLTVFDVKIFHGSFGPCRRSRLAYAAPGRSGQVSRWP